MVTITRTKKRKETPRESSQNVARKTTVTLAPPTLLIALSTINANLRVQRPIMMEYCLGAAVMYIRTSVSRLIFFFTNNPNPAATAVQEGEVVGWYKPANEAFVHPEVISLLDNNNLSHLRDKFGLIGAFTHMDIVQLSLDIQSKDGWATKSNLLNALELKPQSVDWHCLLNVLTQYARPI